jgi:hypothetical protein
MFKEKNYQNTANNNHIAKMLVSQAKGCNE